MLDSTLIGIQQLAISIVDSNVEVVVVVNDDYFIGTVDGDGNGVIGHTRTTNATKELARVVENLKDVIVA